MGEKMAAKIIMVCKDKELRHSVLSKSALCDANRHAVAMAVSAWSEEVRAKVSLTPRHTAKLCA